MTIAMKTVSISGNVDIYRHLQYQIWLRHTLFYIAMMRLNRNAVCCKLVTDYFFFIYAVAAEVVNIAGKRHESEQIVYHCGYADGVYEIDVRTGDKAAGDVVE